MKRIVDFCKRGGIIFLRLSIIVLLFWLISFCPWLFFRVFLYLLVGAFAFIELIYYFFENKPKARFFCSKLLMGLGVIFGAGFIIWTLNFAIRLLNIFFWIFGSDFHIGWIFNDVWNIVFSLPGLLTGAMLFLAGLIMTENDNEEKIYQEELMQRRMLASRQEATA